MDSESQICLIQDSECRVSSVLERNTKEYGKQFMFDHNPETCWNSDHRTPQWVALSWPYCVKIDCIRVQFQVIIE